MPNGDLLAFAVSPRMRLWLPVGISRHLASPTELIRLVHNIYVSGTWESMAAICNLCAHTGMLVAHARGCGWCTPGTAPFW